MAGRFCPLVLKHVCTTQSSANQVACCDHVIQVRYSRKLSLVLDVLTGFPEQPRRYQLLPYQLEPLGAEDGTTVMALLVHRILNVSR